MIRCCLLDGCEPCGMPRLLSRASGVRFFLDRHFLPRGFPAASQSNAARSPIKARYRNAPEAPREVSVTDFLAAAEQQCFHLDHRLLSVSPGTMRWPWISHGFDSVAVDYGDDADDAVLRKSARRAENTNKAKTKALIARSLSARRLPRLRRFPYAPPRG